ncbi:MAG: glycosyltransferase family 4 protein [Planctomycetota bacterium]|jgi:glycosyltransferase involved in cell wall biosynthesis
MICYEFPPLGGGGSRAVYGLSKELARKGHHVDLVTMGFRNLPQNDLVDGVHVNRIQCIRYKKYKCTAPEAALYLFRAIPKVRQLLSQKNYDINHTHFIMPDGLIAWHIKKQANLSYIITAHGSDVPGYNPHRLKMAHRLLSPLWKTITQNAAQIVCPSKSLQSLVVKNGANIKTTLIPYGFYSDRFQTKRKKYKRILVVTRMLKRKGVQYLLEAVKELTLDHEIHIVGDGPYLSTLLKMANQSKTPVKFWGWLDNQSPELKDLYETSKIFVLTSEAENFPVALMEAMAAGLAIITTKGTGCAEVVGETAILVETKSSHAIRDALLTLTENDNFCLELGCKAQKRLKEKFSWDVVVKQYLDLYQQQINDNTPDLQHGKQ